MGRISRRTLLMLVRLLLLIVALLWVALRSCDASPAQEVSREDTAAPPDPKSAHRASRSGTHGDTGATFDPHPSPIDDLESRARERDERAAAFARRFDPAPQPEDGGSPTCVVRAVGAAGVSMPDDRIVYFDVRAVGAVDGPTDV